MDKNSNSPNELIFIGGIDSNKWIKDGKSLSRNYKQGYRVYDSNGIAATLSAQGTGGLGGALGLYLMEDDENANN